MSASATPLTVAAPPKRSYTRKPSTDTRLRLNEFQKDVVLKALKREIEAVRSDRNTPESLKMLAIRELNTVLEQMGESTVATTPDA